MNVYDIVQAKASQLAGLVSVILGLVLIGCASWVLGRVLESESLAYYSYGLKVGELKLAEGSRAHTEAFDLLNSRLSPFLLVLKLTASLGLLSGFLQIGSCFILLMNPGKRSIQLWLTIIGLSCLLSLSGIILPVAHSLTHSIEIKVFLVVSGVTLFLQAHLLVVIFINLRKITRDEPVDEEGKTEVGTTAASSQQTEQQSPVTTIPTLPEASTRNTRISS